MKPAQTAAYLTKAAEILERDGWCQGSMHKPGDGHCAEGAIAVATGYHFMVGPSRFGGAILTQSATWAWVVFMLESQLGGPVASWNDAPDRTAETVVNALHEAAFRLGAVR